MAYDRFLIAPYDQGLVNALESWLIPDQAFSSLKNAYVWRGRVRKRFGGKLMGVGATSSLTAPLLSRFRTPLSGPLTLGGGAGVGITDGAGDATNPAFPVPWNTTIHLPWPEYKIGQYFLINGWHYYVTALGVPAALTPEAGAPITTATFNTTTGVYAFTGVSATSQIYFFPTGDYITSGAGQADGVVEGIEYNVGQQFSIGDVIFTVFDPAAGDNQMLRTDGSIEVATFNLTTGQYHITIAALPNTPVFFYPALPVMGLCNYEVSPINNRPTIGFDTQFIYEFTNSWNRIALNVVFKGNDAQFFWTTNWLGLIPGTIALFVSNYNATEGAGPFPNDDYMYSYVANRAPDEWMPFHPNFRVAGDKIVQARIILPFKNRLVLLNTIEQNAAGNLNTVYLNRCRYSANMSPLDPVAFLQQNEVGFKGSGYLDAATTEAIVSAEFVKDRLIVYFERSTYELVHTGNEVLPFVWQKINTELGAESTFATVPFDKVVLGIGNTGVHACNGANVERIDIKIPGNIFKILNKNEGVARVAGIRDYYVEMVYWTLPDTDANKFAHFPNQVMVYNYTTNSWAFNDDCITTFGYFEQQIDITWADIFLTWEEYGAAWNSGIMQSQFRQVIAGNQQGYVFIVSADIFKNAPVMSITNLIIAGAHLRLTIIDHTLSEDDYIYLDDTQGVNGVARHIYQVLPIIDKDTIQVVARPNFAGVYTGGGTVTRVSNYNIVTKQFNPYIDKGRDVYVAKVDFGVQRTHDGAVTVDYFPSSTQLSMIDEGNATNSILGTSELSTAAYPTIPLEAVATRLWHPIYFQTEGECIQFRIYMSDAQIIVNSIAFEDFRLDGILLHTMPTTQRLF